MATPVARRTAVELGVSLHGLVGTGPGGRITVEDVTRAAAERSRPEDHARGREAAFDKCLLDVCRGLEVLWRARQRLRLYGDAPTVGKLETSHTTHAGLVEERSSDRRPELGEAEGGECLADRLRVVRAE